MAPGNLDTMDGFLIRLLIPIYILISLSLVISHAKAVEPPRSRTVRDMKERIKVLVNPTSVPFYMGETVSIACRAKGGKRIKETPFITFHREFNELISMKLSSGDPGVLIQPVPTDELKAEGENRVKKRLTLGKKTWDTLEYGPNEFYCKAMDMEGHRTIEYFTIDKMPRRRNGNGQRSRRSRHHRLDNTDLTVHVSGPDST